jgi:hypothetical protein
MERSIRAGVAIVIFLTILLFGRQQAAGAIPEPSAHFSPQGGESSPDLLAKKDECKDPKNKNKKKCRGTVKPPPKDIIIPVTGQYAVGGYCTLIVELTDPEVKLNATLMAPLPGKLPEEVHQPGQGCLLTYFRSGETLSLLSPRAGDVRICFAATLGQPTEVYFFDLYGVTPAWIPVPETTILENGITCAPANASGVYTATFTP